MKQRKREFVESQLRLRTERDRRIHIDIVDLDQSFRVGERFALEEVGGYRSSVRGGCGGGGGDSGGGRVSTNDAHRGN
ncbi:hypothetical protein M0804_008311 [Polistes exclamans]|nr:hypothetical protein M0804_008311 [Polistes exclamans]